MRGPVEIREAVKTWGRKNKNGRKTLCEKDFFFLPDIGECIMSAAPHKIMETVDFFITADDFVSGIHQEGKL